MIKKIKLLTTIFLKDYYQDLRIVKKKLNKKSAFTWLMIIFISSIIYLSLNAIMFFEKIGVPILFLKIYLPIITTIIIAQSIDLVCKIFYYSKDLEYIIPLPVKTTEILISKFNTVIITMYTFEVPFLLIPMLMYGILEAKTISFFISTAITIIVFPILFTAIMSIIMLFVMKLSRFSKNQDIFQTIVVFIVTMIIMTGETIYVDQIIYRQNPEDLTRIQIIEMKTDEINKGFLIINPLIEMLDKNTISNKMINFAKVIIITLVPTIVFILLGRKLYLKNILQNKGKKTKKKRKYRYKCRNKIIEYLKKDVKKIIKNPTYFIQYVFKYLLIVCVISLLLNIFIPLYVRELMKDGRIEKFVTDVIALQSILIYVIIMQLIFTFSKLSITAISREGRDAKFMKYTPIPLYKQFKIKAIPQIFLNTIVIIMILTIFYLNIPKVNIGYYVIAFIIAMILNILNSYILLLVDLIKPNLNWTNEESISKDKTKSIYQYVMTIFIFLILCYFANIFENVKFAISVTLIIGIMLMVLILLKRYIKKNINKLFKNIN